MKKLLVPAALVLALVACNKSEPKADAAAAGSADVATSSAAVQAEVKIGDLGLSIPGPAETTVEKIMDGYLIQNPEYSFTVTPTTEKVTMEERQKNAKEFGGENIKAEKFAIGYVVSFFNKEVKTYPVDGDLEVNGKHYAVSSMSMTEQEQANNIKAIKTIH